MLNRTLNLYILFGSFCRIALLRLAKAYTDSQCLIHLLHILFRQPAYVLTQTDTIDGPDLFQQYNGVLFQTTMVRTDWDMGWQRMLVLSAGHGRYDHGWTEPVPHVILDHQHRPYAALFASGYRCQVCIIQIAS